MKVPTQVLERHRRFPSIPNPSPNLESLTQVCTALKEAVELLTEQRTRGQELNATATWGDLVNAGVVSVDQVPKGARV